MQRKPAFQAKNTSINGTTYPENTGISPVSPRKIRGLREISQWDCRSWVKVDPRGTSQTCPVCQAVAKKTLAERMHRCCCGCVLDRDVAAAMVVHQRAFGFLHGTCSGASSQRVAA